MKMLLLAVVTVLAGTAAFSQTQGSAAKSGFDPNEVVCRSFQESGSRLKSSRVCMTRGQWADWRREQRTNTETSQQRRVAPRG